MGLILLLWAVIYFASIFTPPLLDDVDTIHAEAAREMVLRHDWVTLYTDGVRYLEKAPLMYWGVAASYKVFGVHDWSTRLPLMLGVLALLLATYVLGTRAYGERGGLYSAVVLATCLGPYIFTRFQIPDIIVACGWRSARYFFLRSLEEERPSRWVCWGFAATCALNVLTKSLIGLVFPLGAIFLYLLITGNLRHILRLRLFSSSLVFLIIAAPWHILAAMRNPQPGSGEGLSVVLFRQRTVFALPEQARTAGLRHGAAVDFLGIDDSVARALDGISAAELQKDSRRWSEIRGRTDRRRSVPDFSFFFGRW